MIYPYLRKMCEIKSLADEPEPETANENKKTRPAQ